MGWVQLSFIQQGEWIQDGQPLTGVWAQLDFVQNDEWIQGGMAKPQAGMILPPPTLQITATIAQPKEEPITAGYVRSYPIVVERLEPLPSVRVAVAFQLPPPSLAITARQANRARVGMTGPDPTMQITGRIDYLAYDEQLAILLAA
jgi:hypothetical protein